MVKLKVLPYRLAIGRWAPGTAIPASLKESEFYCETRTPEEISVVCDEAKLPADARAQWGWRAFRVVGTLDFALTGILHSLAEPLAAAGISIFAVSTFDTDYILVKGSDLARAEEALAKEGFSFG